MSKTSFDIFISTIADLSKSQGFYQRMYNGIQEMSLDEFSDLKEMINHTYDFKEPIDVIMALEQ